MAIVVSSRPLVYHFHLQTTSVTTSHGPDRGENNREILESLGYDADQINKLVDEGVISKVQGPKNPRVEVIKGE